MSLYRIEPTGRDDEWAFQTVRVSDGVVVGWHVTRERAQAFADNGACPVIAVAEEPDDTDQLEMFGAAA